MSPGLRRPGAKLSERISSIMGTTKRNPLQDFLDLDDLQKEDVILHHEEEGNHHIREEDKDQDGEIMVEFTLRVPKKLKRFIKQFNEQKSRHNELLNNQKMLFEAIHSKTLEKYMTTENLDNPTLRRSNSPERLPGRQSTTIQTRDSALISPGTLKARRKAIGHLASFKHAVDSYVSALKTAAERVARSGLNNVYRIKGVIVTDHYGPDRDIVKYIKILEINKKAERFTRLSEMTPANRIRAHPARWSRESSTSQQGTRYTRKSIKTTTFKTEKVATIQEVGIKGPYEESSGALESRSKLSEDGSPKARGRSPKGSRSRSRDLSSASSRSKGQESLKSDSREEIEESRDSLANTEKQEIMNELKNNIMTHYPSIYQKEEHLMIDRKFQSLENIKWFIRILFLCLVPLNIIIYLVGPYTTFRQLDTSVSDIFSNEDLRRHYIRCHDAIITLILNNNDMFDSLKPEYESSLEKMMDYQMNILKVAYQHIFVEGSKDEWTNILYDYAPKTEADTTVNYQGSFKGSVTNIENAIQKLTNSLYELQSYTRDQFTDIDSELTFYRINSLQKFNKILGDVTTVIFGSLYEGFDSSENLSITILLSEGLMFTVSFFIILRLILIVITSLREILVIFTAIDPQQVIETEIHYKRLFEYLEVSNSRYLSSDHAAQNAITSKDVLRAATFKQHDEQKQKLQKKSKKVNYRNFMREDSFKVLSYYVMSILLCFLLSLLFHFQTKMTIDYIQAALTDSQTFIQLSPVYITTLIALKELTFNKTNYKAFDFPYIQDTISLLDMTLGRTGYTADVPFVDYFKSILDGTPCEEFRTVIPDAQDLYNCLKLSSGRLSTGLITFHNYYKIEVVNVLTMNDDNEYGTIGARELYEYSELIKIVDGVFMEQMLVKWRDDMGDYLSSKENFLVILIVVVSVLNIGVYFVANKGVVGILKNRFKFYRKIYNEYMLGEAPVKEKRIKAALVKYKLLHK